MEDIYRNLRPLRLGEEKKKKKKEETTGQKYNGLPYYMAAINTNTQMPQENNNGTD